MAGLGSRAGVSGQLDREKLEVLWGSRGNPLDWALRRKELVDVQKTVEEVRKSLASLKEALTQIKDDIDDINAKILVIEQQLDAVEQSLTDVEQRLTAAEASLSSIEDAIANIGTEIGDINGSILQLQNDVNTLQTDVSNLTGRVSALENGLTSLTVTADLNTAVRNKEFQWSNTSINTPVAASFGRGWTVASSANDLTQFGVINSTGQTFVRFRTGGTWGPWQDLISLRAEPYALQSNPGTTPFPASVFTAIPLFTSGELSGGIVKTGNSTFTVPDAGLYQFELEVRITGGAASMPPVGTLIGLSIDTTTVPTAFRAGYSAVSPVATTTFIRLICTERLTAGAQRVPYIYNGGAAAYQVTSATLKITRLSA